MMTDMNLLILIWVIFALFNAGIRYTYTCSILSSWFDHVCVVPIKEHPTREKKKEKWQCITSKLYSLVVIILKANVIQKHTN